jgi:hypothetical protein
MADDLKQTGARDGGFTSKPRAVDGQCSVHGVAEAEITRWMNGESDPATEEFLRVVDVLLEANNLLAKARAAASTGSRSPT